MTSLHGNTYYITGLFWSKWTSESGCLSQRTSNRECLMFSLLLSRTSCWTNNSFDSYLRHQWCSCNVTVMIKINDIKNWGRYCTQYTRSNEIEPCWWLQESSCTIYGGCLALLHKLWGRLCNFNAGWWGTLVRYCKADPGMLGDIQVIRWVMNGGIYISIQILRSFDES